MGSEIQVTIDNLISQLQGCGMDMPLSKFTELNISILKEFKKFHVPLKNQAEIISKEINRTVSVSSLAVAMSRLSPSKGRSEQVIIMEKKIQERFVDKSAKLILGTQKEIIKISKGGVTKNQELLIDWRGLAPNENISSWILEYKDKLVAINATGWRWKQIAEAISNHLMLKQELATNTLTSIISLSNKKTKQINI